MANNSVYRYEYFLPSQDIDAARARTDLQRVFGRPGEVCAIESRSINGRDGLYVSASLGLSNEMIAQLARRTPTPLERLLKIETRLVTSEPSFAAASYHPRPPPVSDPAGQSTYEPSSTPAPASSHRREFDAGDRGLTAGTPRYLPRQPAAARGGPATQTPSYAASQYYAGEGAERGQDEDTSHAGPRPTPQDEAPQDEGEVSAEAAAYDARNDAFFFPANSVSAQEIQRRRDMLQANRNGLDR